MNLAYSPNLTDVIQNSSLLIDTSTFIDASKCEPFRDFLSSLQDRDCSFFTVRPVVDEFLCPAKNQDDYVGLAEFLDSFGASVMRTPEPVSDDIAAFNIALNRCKNIHPSYVDRLLLTIPYLYRASAEKIYLVTSNHKDVPRDFFDRVGFVTHDDVEFHNTGFYQLNLEKFNKIKP